MNLEKLLKISSINFDLLNFESAWSGHIPFAYWLVTEKKPKTLVELGTHYGNSYFAFCKAVNDEKLDTKCYAVDSWAGDFHAGKYSNDVYESVVNHNQKYSSFSSLLRSAFDEAVEKFEDKSIDILHIDGLHDYDSVRNDYETWLPKLAPGAIILFHDINAEITGFGAQKFWKEIKNKYQHTFEFTHSFGLGVVQLTSKKTNPLCIFSEKYMSNNDIRLIFEYFGNAVSSGFYKSKIEFENQFLKNKIKDLEWYLIETRVSRISQLENDKTSVSNKKNFLYLSFDWTLKKVSSTLRFFFANKFIIKILSSIKKIGFWQTFIKIFFYIKHLGLKNILNSILKNKSIDFQDNKKCVDINQLINSRFLNCKKLYFDTSKVFTEPCINLITDSIGKSSLFGGVGTALVFSIKMCKFFNYNLRIITRTEVANTVDFNEFIKLQKINFNKKVFFEYRGFESGTKITVSHHDFFISTSWWSTYSIVNQVDPKKITYLVQEDERMFYPNGDDRLRADEIFNRKDINFLVNSHLLYKHFLNESFAKKDNWFWFEPAFPDALYKRNRRNSKTLDHRKKKLFFYARPNNPRNLFYRGIEVLDKLILTKKIDMHEWEIYFVGRYIPNFSFSSGYTPIIVDDLSWKQYADFISDVDVGFCLMYTPHTSYPPMDLIKSGATVVSNMFGVKKALAGFNDKLLITELNIDSLISALDKAIKMTGDTTFKKSTKMNNLINSWDTVFEGYFKKIIR